MAYPIFSNFRTKYYHATNASSSVLTGSVPVAARGKLIGVYGAPQSTPQTAVGSYDVTVNGSTATGMGAVATSTQSAASGTYPFAAPTAAIFVNAGDVLATVSSSVVSSSWTFIVQEF